MKAIFVVILLFAICMLQGGIILAQDEEVTVTNVTVWVKAVDKSGKPATGLSQNDFDIFEDGKKVNATCFEEVTERTDAPAPPADEAQTMRARTGKQIVFLFDLANTSQNEMLHLKKKATEFLEQLASNWNITLASLLPGSVHIQVENSADTGAIQAALDRLTANPTRDIETLNQRRELSLATKRAERLPRKDRRVVAEICGLARSFAMEEKFRSVKWMESLKDFDRYVKRQDPETHQVVLLFSGGISSNPGKQYFDLIRTSNLMREYTRDEMEILREFPECEDEGGYDLHSDFKELVGRLNRHNITFYAVGSRGPINDLLETVRETDRAFHIKDLEFLKDYEDFLALIADETGGIYFGNSLNFKRGFDAILADLNHQYLLCYKPPAHSRQKQHSIEVKAKKPGVKVRHRSGYYD